MRKTTYAVCPECDGTGQVPIQDYRTSVKEADTNLSPKKRFVGAKKFFGGLKKHLTKKVVINTLLIVAGFAALGVIIALGINQHAKDQKETTLHNQYVAKMGYVVALYDGREGKSAKCWITKPRSHMWNDDIVVEGPTFPFNGPNFAWIEVPDRNDAAGFAKNIGVEDVSQCVRNDQ